MNIKIIKQLTKPSEIPQIIDFSCKVTAGELQVNEQSDFIIGDTHFKLKGYLSPFEYQKESLIPIIISSKTELTQEQADNILSN